jgi:hypothetical protein
LQRMSLVLKPQSRITIQPSPNIHTTINTMSETKYIKKIAIVGVSPLPPLLPPSTNTSRPPGI